MRRVGDVMGIPIYENRHLKPGEWVLLPAGKMSFTRADERRILASMQARLDRAFMGSFGGATTASEPAEPFTLDKLREAAALLETIPPPPVFASSVAYPLDDFWQFERDGREYVLGHPDLWAKVPANVITGEVNSFGSIPIVNVDQPSHGDLRSRIAFWIATASHVPGRAPKWPKGESVEPSVKSRLR